MRATTGACATATPARVPARRAGAACPLVLVAALLGLAIPAGPANAGELAPPAADLFYQDVAWSPDGEWLAYSEYVQGPEYDPTRWAIRVARADGSERRRVLENAQFVSWSPDGARLALSSARDGNWELYSVAVDGTDLRRLTTSEADERAPAFSPDGARIAFSSDRDGNREIYVMSADGSEPRRLTHNAAGDYNPAWSPDGAEIVFYRETGDAADQILVVASDGSAERAVTRDGHLNTFPAYLLDGRLTYSSKEKPDGREGLVVVSRDGAERRPLGPAGAFFGRFSPDGGTVAFIAGGWPRSAIYVMRSDGTGVRKIVN